MNRNLTLCLCALALAIVIPLGTLTLNPATMEWSAFWQIRAYLVNHSGIVAMILMSLCIILSIKHWPLEKWLKGLDQQYRLHKYLGISAVFVALFHWLAFLSDDISMGFGWVASKDETYPFWKLIDVMGDPAQLIGEWGFYISATLVLIAWIKYFPHSVFQLTHKLFPYLYLLLVLHMIIFMDAALWLSFPGVVLIICCSLATVACLMTILGLNGKKNRHSAKIKTLTPLSNGIEVVLATDDVDAFNYQSGQFAFVGFDEKERAHPFSLASASNVLGEIRLMIKGNGDYTNALASTLTEGQSVEIEGPYGQFNFDDEVEQQLWVAAGIGIAPFLAAIEKVSSNKKVDLFYTYRETDVSLLKELEERAHLSGVNLHLIDTNTRPRLGAADVINRIEDYSNSSVWFCGPTSLGETLEEELVKKGLPGKRFHRELFEFR